jgi:tRNA(fMet)-specific endonuclease VapC
MLLYMLDTDIVSYIVKEKPHKAKVRMQALLPSALCVSVVTRAELIYGLKQLPANHRTQFAVRELLKIVQILPWDVEASNWYADIRHQLTTTGKLIGELDMMIAAHAISQDAVLVTNNLRHYQRIKAPLMLENWA